MSSREGDLQRIPKYEIRSLLASFDLDMNMSPAKFDELSRDLEKLFFFIKDDPYDRFGNYQPEKDPENQAYHE